MADDAYNKLEKTITITRLKPNEYRLWVVQTEATFEVHKCLGIMLGTEPNLTPLNADGTPNVGQIPQNLRSRSNKWEARHSLAREALLKSLESAELMKVLSIRNSAPANWNRLRDEYHKVLDIEYIRAYTQFHALKKEKIVKMNDHIDHFIKLLQEVEYHKASDLLEMQKGTVNLACVGSYLQ